MDAFRSARSWVRAVLVITVLACVACGSESEDDGPLVGPLGIDDGASEGMAKSALVKGDREVTIALKTGASVIVPMGAVTKPVALGIQRPRDSDAMALVATIGRDRKLASAPYIVTPHGTQFEKDVKVTLPVATAAAGKRIEVAWLSDEVDRNWKIIGPASEVDKKVVVPIKHFSVFVLLYVVGEAELDSGYVPNEAGVSDGRPDSGAPEASLGGDASGEARRDATTVEPMNGNDAGVAPVADAGMDASFDAAFDAGPILTADGAIAPDYRGRILTRFQQCKMVARDGEFTFAYHVNNDEDRCYLECLTTVGCPDLASEWCQAETTDAFIGCWASCLGRRTVQCEQEDRYGAAVYCDGRIECLDGVDEAQCPASSYIQCRDGSRFPTSARCDGELDCGDGSDEIGCNYPAHYFTCANQRRVPPEWECDAFDDCGDGSDERNCQGKLFTCADGTDSISARYVCNGFANCGDGSDEPTRCLAVSCPAVRQ